MSEDQEEQEWRYEEALENLKQELISEFVEKMDNIQRDINIVSYIDYCRAIDELIEEYEEKLK